MVKKVVFQIVLLFVVIQVFSYTWENFGPPGIKANKLCFFFYDHAILCVDSGMYLVTGKNMSTWQYFPFPAMGAVKLNEDSLLVIHADGSYSDGIYSFDLQTHEFSPIKYCFSPNFIVKTNYNERFFVGYEYGLLESYNGMDWSDVPAFTGQSCIDMVCDEITFADLVVATDNDVNNVFYSEDNGIVWEQIIGNQKITELASCITYSILGGICNQDDIWDGFYTSEGEQWDEELQVFGLSALGVDNAGNTFLGWHSATAGLEGIARYYFYGPNAGLLFFNDGLPNLNINDINSPIFFGNNIIYCCTDSGVYFSNDYAVGLEIVVQDVLQIKIFPNPLTTTTTFLYNLEKISIVTIQIFNSQGQQVDKIIQNQQKGKQQVQWNAEGLSTGIYYFRIQAGEQVGSGKMVKIESDY